MDGRLAPVPGEDKHNGCAAPYCDSECLFSFLYVYMVQVHCKRAIRCDVDENLWQNAENRVDLHW